MPAPASKHHSRLMKLALCVPSLCGRPLSSKQLPAQFVNEHTFFLHPPRLTCTPDDQPAPSMTNLHSSFTTPGDEPLSGRGLDEFVLVKGKLYVNSTNWVGGQEIKYTTAYVRRA